MKRILFVLALLILTSNAFADTCATSLMPAFTANQAISICKVTGSAIGQSLIPSTDNTYDLGSTSKTWRTLYTGTSRIAKTSDILRVRQDANRLFTWDASSDVLLSMTWGDSTTAVQKFTVSASTADAADDGTLRLAGGGAAATDGSRGGEIDIAGEEVAGGGDIIYNAGGSDTHQFQVAGTAIANIGGTGILPAVDGDNTISNLGSSSFGFKNINLSDATRRASFFVSNGLYASFPSGQDMIFREASTDKWSIKATTGSLTADATNGGNIVMSKASTGLILGQTTVVADVGTAPGAYLFTPSATAVQLALAQGTADTAGVITNIFKSRATDGTADTIVVSGDTIGTINFKGANGTTFDNAAAIIVKVDATPGAADMPGSIDFQTTPDGSTTLASVLKLDNAKLATFTGAIKSTATTLGWQVRAGANTACNTTCTASHGCVFGQDTGSSNIAVDCTNAAADVCVCSF